MIILGRRLYACTHANVLVFVRSSSHLLENLQELALPPLTFFFISLSLSLLNSSVLSKILGGAEESKGLL